MHVAVLFDRHIIVNCTAKMPITICSATSPASTRKPWLRDGRQKTPPERGDVSDNWLNAFMVRERSRA